MKFVSFPRQGADPLYVNGDCVRALQAAGPGATAIYFNGIEKAEYVSAKIADVLKAVGSERP